MSSLGNLIGDVGAAFGDVGHKSVEALTKSKPLQDRLDGLLGMYDKTSSASSVGLDKYIADFLAGNKTATSRSNQEQQAIDRYYNGDVERQLADIRTRKAAASDQALQRALAYMTNASSRDQITRSGTGSSYDRQMGLKTGADLTLSNLLSNLDQERSDFNFLQGNQLGLLGKRTALADAMAARDLTPSGAMQANLGWNADILGKLLGLDQTNHFYGVKYNPSGSEMAGNVIGDIGGATMDYFTGKKLGLFGNNGTASTPNINLNWSPGSFTPSRPVQPWLSGYGDNFGTINSVPNLGGGSMWDNMLKF